MGDWFTDNAPKKTPKQPAKQGDWFAANAPNGGLSGSLLNPELDMNPTAMANTALSRQPQWQKGNMAVSPTLPPKGNPKQEWGGTKVTGGAAALVDAAQIPGQVFAPSASYVPITEEQKQLYRARGAKENEIPAMVPRTPSLTGALEDVAGIYHGAKQLVADPIKRWQEGDKPGAISEGAVNVPLLIEMLRGGYKAGKGVVSEATSRLVPDVAKLTGTTPTRIAELQSFPQRIEGVRQTVINAEHAAHQAASDAFPKFEQPIKTGKMVEKPAQGPTLVDEWGESSPKALVPETTTFQALQEQRSNLLKSIANEKRAVMRGQTPRFDLADMYKQLQQLDETMNKAALEQGGQAGLDQLNAARQKFGKYMQDYHAPGSPLRGFLESEAGATDKIVKQLINPDTGARALETLRNYGVDTSQIEAILKQGNRPLRVTSVEAGKLRKAGSPDAYTEQRLREAISQATTNEIPSAAEARLPATSMRSTWPSIVRQVPGSNFFTPRKITSYRLQKALEKRLKNNP